MNLSLRESVMTVVCDVPMGAGPHYAEATGGPLVSRSYTSSHHTFKAAVLTDVLPSNVLCV